MADKTNKKHNKAYYRVEFTDKLGNSLHTDYTDLETADTNAQAFIAMGWAVQSAVYYKGAFVTGYKLAE